MIEVVSDTSQIHTLYVCPLNAMKMFEIRSPYFCTPVAAKIDTLACTCPENFGEDILNIQHLL